MARSSGRYRNVSGFATTPSRPAPSNCSNHRSASARSRVAGARCTGAETPASARSSSARRSVSGADSSASSSSASRSKATNDVGVRSASVRTREAAGWMRSLSASKSSRPSRATTISPSITHRSGSRSRSASTSSGKYLVSGLPLRLPSSTSAPSRKTIARNPSHFAS